MTKSVRRDATKKTETPEESETSKKSEAAQHARAEQPTSDRDTWDGLDESGLESFPASDAPASWAGRDIVPPNAEKSAEP